MIYSMANSPISLSLSSLTLFEMMRKRKKDEKEIKKDEQEKAKEIKKNEKERERKTRKREKER